MCVFPLNLFYRVLSLTLQWDWATCDSGSPPRVTKMEVEPEKVDPKAAGKTTPKVDPKAAGKTAPKAPAPVSIVVVDHWLQTSPGNVTRNQHYPWHIKSFICLCTCIHITYINQSPVRRGWKTWKRSWWRNLGEGWEVQGLYFLIFWGNNQQSSAGSTLKGKLPCTMSRRSIGSFEK